MPFSKSFPHQTKDKPYPQWVEIYLTQEEEQQVEQESKRMHFQLMDECLNDAKTLAIKHGMNEDNNITDIATALFEKRASHSIFWKEAKAKEKFDERFKQG